MNDHSQSVQKQFGDVAANYTTSAVHVSGVDLDAMLAAAHLRGDERILDAGCGAGHTALAFAKQAAQVIAYDLTPQMLEQVHRLAAERGIHNITTQQGDVSVLPFADDSFDLVVSRYSAHHWPQPEAALHEFKRVLKPDGRFILTDVVSFDDLTCDTYLQSLEVLRDPSHVRDHTIGQWQAIFDRAGFTAEVVLRFDVPLKFHDWHTRMNTPAEQVTAIRALLASAPGHVRAALHLPDDWSTQDNFRFAIPGAVISA